MTKPGLAQDKQEQDAVEPVLARIEDRGKPQALPAADFIKIEKNLASLGFFTPSSKRIKETKKKTITFVKTINGKTVEARAIILPSAEYGLPITADQDKYLGLQKLVTDLRRRGEEIRNVSAAADPSELENGLWRVTGGRLRLRQRTHPFDLPVDARVQLVGPTDVG
jgi:hypothetical protein